MKSNLKAIAYQRRLDVLDMVYKSNSGHIGGSMSCMDALVSLYYGVMDIEKIKKNMPDRDRFVLSKGHNAEALYSVLADKGLIEKSELSTYTEFGTRLAGHPTKDIPGVELATGALGHGVCVAVGMAIALKCDQPQAHVYAMCGDGEQAEGSVWEAAMAAAKYKLDNYTLMIDRNRLQISGSTEEVMPLDDLMEKYRAFGFNVIAVDGHDYGAICAALKTREEEKPTVVILNTIKGKGSAIMENKADWHHHTPSEEQYETIKADLERALEEASNG